MSGPSRELPPLRVSIIGDNSDALAAFKGVIQAAKATGKAVAAIAIQQSNDMNAAMATSLASYKKLAKAQENYGRLTSTFKNMKSAKSRGGLDLNALVGNAEKTAKAVAGTEAKVMAKADRERAQSVIGARNALRAQAAQVNKEEAANVAEKLRRDRQLDKSAKRSRDEEDKAGRARWQLWGREKAQEIKNDNESIARSRRGYVARLRASTQEALQNAKHDEAAMKDTKKKEAEKRSGYVARLRASTQEALQNAKHDEAAIKSTQDAAEKKAKTLQGIQDYFKKAQTEQLKASVAASLQNAKHDEAAINSTKKATESKAKALQGIKDHFAKAHKERLQQMGRELTQQAKNDAADIRARRARERAEARANKQSSGGGLGNRADIYMHSGALRSISGGIQNVLEPWAQLESHIATIKIFTGTIESARAVADDMQQFALVSPYSLNSVMEATALLMKFGQTSEDATATVKMLGDVAGGNSERLKHVALGVAQAVSLGRLQGQELRQMTEGGFNPLRIAAEHASGIGVKQKYTDDEEKAIKAKMAYFDDLMRKRKLDAKFVTAALKLTTSKGGRHAGAVEEQSKTPIGLATQIMESVSLVSIEAVKLFDKELRAMLTTVLETITKFIQWMKANKDLVAQIAITVARVVGAMIAFHTLGLVVAWVGWIFKTLGLLLTTVGAVIRGLTWTYYALSVALSIATALTTAAGRASIFAGAAAAQQARAAVAAGTATAVTGRASLLAGAQMAVAWIMGLGPIAWVIAGVTALAVAIWYLRSQNGLVGMFQDAMWWGGALIGFFTNFGHNMQNIFSFIGANWHLLLADMILTAAPILTIFEYMTGMDLRSMATGVEKGTKDSGYDMSMLKLDGPNLNPLSFLDGIPMPNNGLTVPEKPNINFEDYITAGKDGKHGKKEHVEKTRDHALAGSNEQAQRMYDYTQAMMGSTGATTKDNAPMKQVALLEQIARNTQPDFDRGDSIGDMDID